MASSLTLPSEQEVFRAIDVGFRKVPLRVGA